VGHSKFEGRTFEQGKTVAAAVISWIGFSDRIFKIQSKSQNWVVCHTDNRGMGQNLKLSQARWESEIYRLQGIDKKRITGKGYGGNRSSQQWYGRNQIAE
jgi:hypothetical protein